jgi:hypothetical protein
VLVTELCPGGNLLKFLFQSRVSDNSTPNNVNKVSTLTNHQLLEMAMHVASGMVHLSAQKVLGLYYNQVFNFRYSISVQALLSLICTLLIPMSDKN